MGCGRSMEHVKRAETLKPSPIKCFGAVDLTGNSPRYQDQASFPDKSFQPPSRLSDLATLYPSFAMKAPLFLDYVYGYCCTNSRNNLFYLSTSDLIVYPCASLVVMMSVSSNTQRFLGGGEVHRVVGHFGKVLGVAVNKERDTIGTSDTCAQPTICIWKLPSTEPSLTIPLPPSAIGCDLLSFSSDSKMIAAVDLTPIQVIHIFEIRSGTQLCTVTAAPERVNSIAFHPKQNEFCTVGAGNVTFWTEDGGSYRPQRRDIEGKGLVVGWFRNGGCVTAGNDGKVILWVEKAVKSSRQVLPESVAILSLSIFDDCVLVGGQDAKIHVLDMKFKETRVIDTPGAPISLDMSASGIICGTEEGILLEFGKIGRVILMDSHTADSPPSFSPDSKSCTSFISVCSNRIKRWDIVQRKCTASGVLEVGPCPSPSQCLCVSSRGEVAVGHRDGHFTVRASGNQLNNIVAARRGINSEITVMKYSLGGEFLAVGTIAGTVLVYNARKGYSLGRELKGHREAVMAVDWNDWELRTQDRSRSVRCWSVETGEVAKESGAWGTDPMIATSESPFPVVCAAKAHKTSIVAQGNSIGLLEIHVPNSNPSLFAFKGHSGPITSLYWTLADDFLFTLSQDLTILQWKLA